MANIQWNSNAFDTRISSFDDSPMVDIDGNIYPVVKIGNQIWTTKNLMTTKYRDGSSITNVTDNTAWAALTTEAYCWYSNNYATYGAVYGALYNWYAVNDSRKIAPLGWHVATNIDYSTLIAFLGGGGAAGGKLKESGTVHWLDGSNGTNESRFTALGNSYRSSNGSFSTIKQDCAIHTSTSFSETNNYYLWLSYFVDTVIIYNDGNKKTGCAIRCIKD